MGILGVKNTALESGRACLYLRKYLIVADSERKGKDTGDQDFECHTGNMEPLTDFKQ